MRFFKNVFIIVTVRREERNEEADYGFAQLQNNLTEEEVLFNISSFFTIDSVKTESIITEGGEKKVMVIRLVYGEMAAAMKKID
jgi:hypothetical protein